MNLLAYLFHSLTTPWKFDAVTDANIGIRGNKVTYHNYYNGHYWEKTLPFLPKATEIKIPHVKTCFTITGSHGQNHAIVHFPISEEEIETEDGETKIVPTFPDELTRYIEGDASITPDILRTAMHDFIAPRLSFIERFLPEGATLHMTGGNRYDNNIRHTIDQHIKAGALLILTKDQKNGFGEQHLWGEASELMGVFVLQSLKARGYNVVIDSPRLFRETDQHFYHFPFRDGVYYHEEYYMDRDQTSHDHHLANAARARFEALANGDPLIDIQDWEWHRSEDALHSQPEPKSA